MYTSPDFVKISVKAKDVFSSYASTCHYDETTLFTHIEGGNTCRDQATYQIYLDLYPSNIHQCYSSSNP